MGLAENKIHQGDCIALLEKLEPGSVDLAFADPPFNIGYEYDVYQDRKPYDDYLDWTRRWMSSVRRALKPTGTFWIAIGDEYAAEFKLIAQNDLKMTCRSWVIWYYTFGVNCKYKFNRSHAHLFHFVLDPKKFTFNAADPEIRVPSARQLVYADTRANPDGRLPDDTWILRPQDVPHGFSPDQDTWYFPRVAGTFKERAGFHGCQMPEQLLGRIIRASSNAGDLVLDPFGGSATTLAAAKKLGRRWLGFELSKEYAAKANARVNAAKDGQDLDGSAEPQYSAPNTANGKTLAAKNAKRNGHSSEIEAVVLKKVAAPEPIQMKQAARPRKGRSLEIDEMLIDAYKQTHQGFSTDRLIADPELNGAFVEACQRHGIGGLAADWNKMLLCLRKSGRLPRLESRATRLWNWQEMDAFSFASEIALARLTVNSDRTLDDVLCDPGLASQLDRLASKLAPGFSPLHYRWAALTIRKRASTFYKLAEVRKESLGRKDLPRAISCERIDFDKVSDSLAVYLLRGSSGQNIYVGETFNLRVRLRTHFEFCDPAGWATGAPLAVRKLELPHRNELRVLQVDLAKRFSTVLNIKERPKNNFSTTPSPGAGEGRVRESGRPKLFFGRS